MGRDFLKNIIQKRFYSSNYQDILIVFDYSTIYIWFDFLQGILGNFKIK